MASPTRLPSLRRTTGKSRPVSMFEGPLTNIPDLSTASIEAESLKKTKRRSLLAQLSRKTPVQTKDQEVDGEDEEEGYIGRSTPSDGVRNSDESSGRDALDEATRSMLPLPPSKLSRPVSMIPPRGSSNKTSKSRTHLSSNAKETNDEAEAARAESLAALQGTASVPASKPVMLESGLQRSGSTRLPQAPRIGGPAIPSRTTSARLKDTHSRKSSKVNGIQAATMITVTEERKSPSKSRSESVDVSTANKSSNEASLASTQSSSGPSRTRTAGPVAQTASPPRSSNLSKPRPTSQIAVPPSKPAFNTYQQHYSPVKSALPKPPIPSGKPLLKSLPSADDDTSIPFEVTKQQIELLQLSLLHQSSAKCMSEYTASAKRKLGKMHNKLRKDYENLRATELVHQRVSNLAALDNWCTDTGLLVENLQILSLVYSDLTSLMEEGSRHGEVVATFELWMHEAEVQDSTTFLQPLSDDWRTAHASLALKLRSIQRNLRVLPPTPLNDENSGLQVILKACTTLVDDMLKELDVMVKLEKELLARENVRVEHEVKSLVANDVNETETWMPVWQKVS